MFELKEDSELHKLIIKHYGLGSTEQIQMFGKMQAIAEQYIRPAMPEGSDADSRHAELLTIEAALRLSAAFVTKTRHSLGDFASTSREAEVKLSIDQVESIPEENIAHVFTFQLDTPAALALLQMIQIGLQHPLSSGVVATTCRKLGETMAHELVQAFPQLDSIIRLGWEGVIR